ncbi:TetR/AcrR family transcriptional regulator [Solimonas soli]|uniref:TetR/AcrR family transcriptional regulator n=1 Tax=Solimonas soli TaxID=413479 RepID=UPI0004B50318|nr:helix-turn-helix domain-containing protein [Solimonas soli]
MGVIDVRGLEALSLELVAHRLGVKAPSLYYHFRQKAELLAEVARLILLDAKAPRNPSTDWKETMIALCVATRHSILQHPNAAPLLLQFFPRHLLIASYDYWVTICPLPMEHRMVLVEGLEKLTFGSALFEAACRARGVEPMPPFDHKELPQLAAALRASHLDGEALFVAAIRRYLDGFLAPEPVAAKPAATRKAPAKRKPAAKKRAAHA